MKYTQFKEPYYGYISVIGREDDELERGYADDVRISEWIEIDFPPLSQAEVVQAQLAAFDAEQRKLVAEHLDALHKIAEARAKLLSLTHEVTP